MRNVLSSKAQKAKMILCLFEHCQEGLSPSWIAALSRQRTCIIEWSYEPCCAGDPKWMGHSEEFWQNMVHSRRKLQSTPVFLPGEPQRQYEKAKSMTLEDEPHRLEGIQQATEEEQRAITNSSRKNEVAGPKQKWHSFVGVSGGESKVWCCKKQCCIATWNVRTMNQGNSIFWPRSAMCHTCSKPVVQS